MVAFCPEQKDCDLLFPGTGEVPIAVHDLGAGFLGDQTLEIRVRDDIVRYEYGVGEAEDQKGNGWGDSVGLGDWKEDQEGLKGGSDKEEGAEREVGMERLANS